MASRLIMSIFLASTLNACSDTSVSKVGDVGDEVPDPDPDPVPFSTDWGQWLSMALTNDARPAISFYDRDHGGVGFAIGTLEDGAVTWSFEAIDGYPGASGLDPGDRGTYTSLAFAEDGTAWVSYYDQGAKALRYGQRHPTLGAWSTGVADVGDGMTPDAGLFSSIAIGADGMPVIAHYDKGASTLRVARWNGGNFVGGVFDRGEAYIADTGGEDESREADVGQFVRLRIIDGVEYMAYYDAANGDLKFSVGTDIHLVDTEGDVGQWPDFAVRDGTIHITYQDAGLQHLKYAVGTPGAWAITTIDSAPYSGADTALYFHGDKPGVVYFDGRENNMKHAIVNDAGWATRDFATEGATGFHNETLSIEGKSYVACYDYTQRNVYFAPLD
jgi:hypothetical protein